VVARTQQQLSAIYWISPDKINCAFANEEFLQKKFVQKILSKTDLASVLY
jgi:hypothetical protein